jgi:molecular chaperone GrpE (heat shock protein)
MDQSEERHSTESFARIVSNWKEDCISKLRDIQGLRVELRRERESHEQDIRSFLLSLIETLDRYDRMLKSTQEALSQEDIKAARVLKNFASLRKELARDLAKIGVKAMQVADGDEFIPGLHKAEMDPEPHDTIAQGHIIRVERPGYFWGNQVLRTASVVIAAAPQDH